MKMTLTQKIRAAQARNITPDQAALINQEARIYEVLVLIVLSPIVILMGLLALVPSFRDDMTEIIFMIADAKATAVKTYIVNRILD